MENYEYEHNLILTELRQFVAKWEQTMQQVSTAEAEEIKKDIQWHKEMLQKYR